MTPEALVIQREKRRAIRRTVTHLLRRDCELLTRRYFRGESIQQIAGAMRMTENHVYVAIHRAEKRMENKLRLNNPGLFD